jgi:hypothetical protein
MKIHFIENLILHNYKLCASLLSIVRPNCSIAAI